MRSASTGTDMRIISVNTGPVRQMTVGTQRVGSAIDKRAASKPVALCSSGLSGDEQADSRFHGGPDQAVYIYSADDYRWWAEQLGRDLVPGIFGENLTIDGMPDDLFVGDRLLIGRVLLEVTGPRLPCSKLAAVMGDDDFARTFITAERPGAYCRVLNEGRLSAGDAVNLISGTDVSMRELFRLNYDSRPSRDALQRVLDVPLAERLRDKFARRLERLVTAGE